MKYITFFIIIIFTFLSCRTTRRHVEELRSVKQSSLSEREVRWQHIQKDSTRRYWYVMTDSILYFHPDSGLWAHGAQLYTEEYTLHIDQQQHGIRNKDSAAYEQYASEVKQSLDRKRGIPWYVYAIVVVSLLVVGWVGKRK